MASIIKPRKQVEEICDRLTEPQLIQVDTVFIDLLTNSPHDLGICLTGGIIATLNPLQEKILDDHGLLDYEPDFNN